VSIPQEIDLQYAVAAALVGRAIPVKNKADAVEIYGHILNFAGKLKLDYQVFCKLLILNEILF